MRARTMRNPLAMSDGHMPSTYFGEWHAYYEKYDGRKNVPLGKLKVNRQGHVHFFKTKRTFKMKFHHSSRVDRYGQSWKVCTLALKGTDYQTKGKFWEPVLTGTSVRWVPECKSDNLPWWKNDEDNLAGPIVWHKQELVSVPRVSVSSAMYPFARR